LVGVQEWHGVTGGGGERPWPEHRCRFPLMHGHRQAQEGLASAFLESRRHRSCGPVLQLQAEPAAPALIFRRL
jgi:hypothetical protein